MSVNCDVPIKHIETRKRKQFNLESQMLSSAKSRAKKKNIPFNLDITDIQIPKYCPILGIELKRNNNIENRDCSPSLDRIIPEKGYTKGNVWVISQKANFMKGNGNPTEFSLLVNKLKQQFVNKTHALSFRVDDKLLRRIEEKCKEKNKSFSELNRILWLAYFEAEKNPLEQKLKEQQFEPDWDKSDLPKT